MSTSDIVLLGDPRLRVVCHEVEQLDEGEAQRLLATLAAFRKERGFGRAISAPQIGIARRLIAVNLGKESPPFIMVNPVITERSEALFSLWDDCFSFPDLLVRVSRHKSVTVEYSLDGGGERMTQHCDQALSELLQHEIDHLDGILAVDRATGDNPIVLRSVYEANREYFDSTVEYTIVPTV